jgi:hypothetical protein
MLEFIVDSSTLATLGEAVEGREERRSRMEVRDVTQELTRTLFERRVSGVEPIVDTVLHAEVDPEAIQFLYLEPKAVAEAAGLTIRDDSQYNVTAVNRPPDQAAAARARAARAIVIIIHYTDCSGEIIVICGC